MTAKDSGEAGAAAPDFGVLAEAVTASVEGAKRPEPTPATTVAEALRQRASGASYAAIGRQLGVPPRKVSTWCRAADPAAAVRRPRATTRSKPVAVRLPLPLHRAVTKRAGRGPVGAVIVDLVAAGLAKPAPDDAEVWDAAERREIAQRVIAATNALGALEVQIRAAGRLLNQIAKHLGVYRELPLAITDELAAVRESMEKISTEAAAIREALDGVAR